jgi:hypothetical protein
VKKLINVVLLVCLIISFPVLALTSVNAQEKLNIAITPDGNIEPATKLLEQNDNIYTFKGDILGTIDVHAHDIVIDGAGYTLTGGILLAANHKPNDDHNADCCLNVVIKNLKISNGGITSGAGGKHYTFVGNYFENSRIRFMGNAGVGEDLFTHNTFVGVTFDMTYGGGSLIVMTENNLVNVDMIAFGSYYPKLDQNYYGDYTLRYSATKTISGVWDMPYVLSVEEPGVPNACTVDNRPLVNPVTGFEVPHFNGPLPPAKGPSTNANTGTSSSSTGANAKEKPINANAGSSFSSSAEAEQITGIDVESGVISGDALSSEQTVCTSNSIGMIALIAGILTIIVVVLSAIVLAVKKRNK